MNPPSTTQYLLEQIGRARESLGVALGLTQDIRQIGLDVEQVSSSLARAVGALFAAGKPGGLDDSSKVAGAMDHLRETLTALQDVRSDDASLQEATATVARTLAILFPVLKALPDFRAVPGAGDAPRRPSSISRLPQQPTDDERRQAVRKAIDAELGFQSDTNFFTGFTTDISSGGLFVATYDVLEHGSAINVNFHLPDGPVMSLNGRVMWTREYNETVPDMEPGMGIKFEGLSAGEERAINEYLANSNPMFYDE